MREWYVLTARESWKLFLRFLMSVMKNTADLTVFDRGQNLMIRNFRMNISENARLIGFSSHIFASAYTNWLNEIQIISRRHGFGRLCIIKE